MTTAAPLAGAASARPSAIRPAVSRGRPAAIPALANEMAPPLWLPAGHFAAALVFWTAGAVALPWIAADLAAGAFPLPRVVAVAHLFTLGWITTSIQGALYQFLPVALGVPIRSERAAWVTGALYAAGLALFVGGMLAGASAVFVSGAALFGAALLGFAANLVATLASARERGLTWWCLAGAVVFLGVTVALGAALAGNLRWGWLGAHRFHALGLHLHLAIGGWVLPVVVGVAHRLFPMFLLSHGASERPERAAAALLVGGSAATFVLAHLPWAGGAWAGGALLGAGLLAFLVQAALYFRHSRRPTLDPGMRLAAAGLVSLAVALGLAPLFLSRGLAAPGLATAYGIALVLGGLSTFVAGHYYKIVPFLFWFHRFGPLVGRRDVPRVAELYAERTAHLAAALIAAGALGLVAATLAGSPWAARAAAAAFAAGALVLDAQMISIFRRKPR